MNMDLPPRNCQPAAGSTSKKTLAKHRKRKSKKPLELHFASQSRSERSGTSLGECSVSEMGEESLVLNPKGEDEMTMDDLSKYAYSEAPTSTNHSRETGTGTSVSGFHDSNSQLTYLEDSAMLINAEDQQDALLQQVLIASLVQVSGNPKAVKRVSINSNSTSVAANSIPNSLPNSTTPSGDSILEAMAAEDSLCDNLRRMQDTEGSDDLDETIQASLEGSITEGMNVAQLRLALEVSMREHMQSQKMVEELMLKQGTTGSIGGDDTITLTTMHNQGSQIGTNTSSSPEKSKSTSSKSSKSHVSDIQFDPHEDLSSKTPKEPPKNLTDLEKSILAGQAKAREADIDSPLHLQRNRRRSSTDIPTVLQEVYVPNDKRLSNRQSSRRKLMQSQSTRDLRSSNHLGHTGTGTPEFPKQSSISPFVLKRGTSEVFHRASIISSGEHDSQADWSESQSANLKTIYSQDSKSHGSSSSTTEKATRTTRRQTLLRKANSQLSMRSGGTNKISNKHSSQVSSSSDQACSDSKASGSGSGHSSGTSRKSDSTSNSSAAVHHHHHHTKTAVAVGHGSRAATGRPAEDDMVPNQTGFKNCDDAQTPPAIAHSVSRTQKQKRGLLKKVKSAGCVFQSCQNNSHSLAREQTERGDTERAETEHGETSHAAYSDRIYEYDACRGEEKHEEGDESSQWEDPPDPPAVEYPMRMEDDACTTTTRSTKRSRRSIGHSITRTLSRRRKRHAKKHGRRRDENEDEGRSLGRSDATEQQTRRSRARSATRATKRMVRSLSRTLSRRPHNHRRSKSCCKSTATKDRRKKRSSRRKDGESCRKHHSKRVEKEYEEPSEHNRDITVVNDYPYESEKENDPIPVFDGVYGGKLHKNVIDVDDLISQREEREQRSKNKSGCSRDDQTSSSSIHKSYYGDHGKHRSRRGPPPSTRYSNRRDAWSIQHYSEESTRTFATATTEPTTSTKSRSIASRRKMFGETRGRSIRTMVSKNDTADPRHVLFQEPPRRRSQSLSAWERRGSF